MQLAEGHVTTICLRVGNSTCEGFQAKVVRLAEEGAEKGLYGCASVSNAAVRAILAEAAFMEG